MLFALISLRAQRASTYDISAERNVWLQSALRSFFDRLRLHGNRSLCDRLRSFAIIWKPALSARRLINKIWTNAPEMYAYFLVSSPLDTSTVGCV